MFDGEDMSKLQQPQQAPVRPTPQLQVAPFEGFDRAAVLSVPQELIDEQLAGLTEGELKLMLTVVRATNGGQRQGVALSVRTLCHGGLQDVLPGKGTGLSARTIQAACTTLETAGYVRIVRRTSPDGSGQPSLFSLPLVTPGMAGNGDATPPKFPGYTTARRTRLPLVVVDMLLADLSGAELKVLLYVLRQTFSAGSPSQAIPMARLVDSTGLSLRHTRLAVSGLTAQGLLLVQQRQERDRGKLPSLFGVQVLGEPAPFSDTAAGQGAAGRSGKVDDSTEQARPVWLLPSMEDEVPGTPVSTWIVDEADRAPSPLRTVFPVVTPGASASPNAAGANAPQAAAPSRSAPPRNREVPAEALRDGHPVWAAVKRILAKRLSPTVFMERIAPTTSVGGGGPELLVAVQSEYHRWWLESKLGRQVQEALTEAGYPEQRIRYLNYNGTLPKQNPDQ
jgi:hypothetical protein